MALHEGSDLFLRKKPCLALGKVPQFESCLCHAPELKYCQAAVAAHAANLAVQALLQRYGE